MATDYKWAHNKSKLHRAHLHITAQGGEVTEDAIKRRYKALGGLVIVNEEEPENETENLNKLSVSALKDKAAELEIDITDLSTKAQLIAAIEAAEVA